MSANSSDTFRFGAASDQPGFSFGALGKDKAGTTGHGFSFAPSTSTLLSLVDERKGVQVSSGTFNLFRGLSNTLDKLPTQSDSTLQTVDEHVSSASDDSRNQFDSLYLEEANKHMHSSSAIDRSSVTKQGNLGFIDNGTTTAVGAKSAFELITKSFTQYPEAISSAIEEADGANPGSAHVTAGLFPEIQRAYVVVNSTLFLWSISTAPADPITSQLLVYRCSHGTIRQAHLCSVRPDVFDARIRFVLVLLCDEQLECVAVEASSQQRSVHIVLHPCDISSRLDCDAYALASDSQGRTFLGGSNGNIYEFSYSAPKIQVSMYNTDEEQVTKKSRTCTKSGAVCVINRSVSGFFDKVQQAFGVKQPAVVQMCIDESRQSSLLFVMHADCGITQYKVIKEGIEELSTLSYSELIAGCAELLKAGNASNTQVFNQSQKLVSLYVLSSIDSADAVACAVTDKGHRVFLRLAASAMSSASQLRVSAVRLAQVIDPECGEVDTMLSPDTVLTASAVDGATLMVARCSQPTDIDLPVIDLSQSASPILMNELKAEHQPSCVVAMLGVPCAQDLDGVPSYVTTSTAGSGSGNNNSSLFLTKKFNENVEYITLPSDVLAISRTTFRNTGTYTQMYKELSTSIVESRNIFVSQHALPSQVQPVLTTSGLQMLHRQRPLELVVQAIAQTISNPSSDAILILVRNFGVQQVVAMLAAVASNNAIEPETLKVANSQGLADMASALLSGGTFTAAAAVTVPNNAFILAKDATVQSASTMGINRFSTVGNLASPVSSSTIHPSTTTTTTTTTTTGGANSSNAATRNPVPSGLVLSVPSRVPLLEGLELFLSRLLLPVWSLSPIVSLQVRPGVMAPRCRYTCNQWIAIRESLLSMCSLLDKLWDGLQVDSCGVIPLLDGVTVDNIHQISAHTKASVESIVQISTSASAAELAMNSFHLLGALTCTGASGVCEVVYNKDVAIQRGGSTTTTSGGTLVQPDLLEASSVDVAVAYKLQWMYETRRLYQLRALARGALHAVTVFVFLSRLPTHMTIDNDGSYTLLSRSALSHKFDLVMGAIPSTLQESLSTLSMSSLITTGAGRGVLRSLSTLLFGLQMTLANDSKPVNYFVDTRFRVSTVAAPKLAPLYLLSGQQALQNIEDLVAYASTSTPSCMEQMYVKELGLFFPSVDYFIFHALRSTSQLLVKAMQACKLSTITPVVSQELNKQVFKLLNTGNVIDLLTKLHATPLLKVSELDPVEQCVSLLCKAASFVPVDLYLLVSIFTRLRLYSLAAVVCVFYGQVIWPHVCDLPQLQAFTSANKNVTVNTASTVDNDALTIHAGNSKNGSMQVHLPNVVTINHYYSLAYCWQKVLVSLMGTDIEQSFVVKSKDFLNSMPKSAFHALYCMTNSSFTPFVTSSLSCTFRVLFTAEVPLADNGATAQHNLFQTMVDAKAVSQVLASTKLLSSLSKLDILAAYKDPLLEVILQEFDKRALGNYYVYHEDWLKAARLFYNLSQLEAYDGTNDDGDDQEVAGLLSMVSSPDAEEAKQSMDSLYHEDNLVSSMNSLHTFTEVQPTAHNASSLQRNCELLTEAYVQLQKAKRAHSTDNKYTLHTTEMNALSAEIAPALQSLKVQSSILGNVEDALTHYHKLAPRATNPQSAASVQDKIDACKVVVRVLSRRAVGNWNSMLQLLARAGAYKDILRLYSEGLVSAPSSSVVEDLWIYSVQTCVFLASLEEAGSSKETPLWMSNVCALVSNMLHQFRSHPELYPLPKIAMLLFECCMSWGVNGRIDGEFVLGCQLGDTQLMFTTNTVLTGLSLHDVAYTLNRVLKGTDEPRIHYLLGCTLVLLAERIIKLPVDRAQYTNTVFGVYGLFKELPMLRIQTCGYVSSSVFTQFEKDCLHSSSKLRALYEQ